MVTAGLVSARNEVQELQRKRQLSGCLGPTVSESWHRALIFTTPMNTRLCCVQCAIATSFLLLLGTPARADETNTDCVKWLIHEMESAHTITPGMTSAQLLALFVREPGYANAVSEQELAALRRGSGKNTNIIPAAITYRLRSCSLIKIDVEFASDWYDPKPETKIQWISKTYLEPAHLQ